MSLKDPSQKMSKSAVDPRSRILITDDAPAISEKVRLALTDSVQGIEYDPSSRPGISNLIEILSHFTPNSSPSDTEHQSCEDIAAEFGSSSKRAFKEHVAGTITNNLKDIRERYLELTETKGGKLYVETVAIAGREAAERSAESTLDLVKEAVGLIGRRPQ
jgi:tryptophanyl-tRNA synthetase